MKISAINSYKKALNPTFGDIHPAYVAKMSERLSSVQHDVVELKEKADNSAKREKLIIKQNQDMLKSLAILGNMIEHLDDTQYERSSRANRIIELWRKNL